MRIRSSLLLILLVPALAAAGCGDDDEGGGGQATAPATTPMPPAERTTPTATTPAAGRSSVAIAATEFKFSPANLDMKAGRVTFRLRNDGGAPHALEVEGNGVEQSSSVIQGGQSTTLSMNLRPGRYEIYCPVGNHKDMGMTGTLTVS